MFHKSPLAQIVDAMKSLHAGTTQRVGARYLQNKKTYLQFITKVAIYAAAGFIIYVIISIPLRLFGVAIAIRAAVFIWVFCAILWPLILSVVAITKLILSSASAAIDKAVDS